jgi:hypothetical protein
MVYATGSYQMADFALRKTHTPGDLPGRFHPLVGI